MVPGRFGQQPAGVTVAGLGDRPLRPSGSGGVLRRVLQTDLVEPGQVLGRPRPPGRIHQAVAQQLLLDPVAGAHQIHPGVLAGPHQLACCLDVGA